MKSNRTMEFSDLVNRFVPSIYRKEKGDSTGWSKSLLKGLRRVDAVVAITIDFIGAL